MGSDEWRISVKALAASYAGNQVTFCRAYSQHEECQCHVKLDTTYPIVLGQALLEQRGLDERREPLALVPVAHPVACDLPEPHYDGVHATPFCDILQDVLSDPLALAVAGSEGR